MRIGNTCARNHIISKQRVSGKSQDGFGQMLSTQSSSVRNRDSITFSAQRPSPETDASRPATKIPEADDPELHGVSLQIFTSYVSDETRTKLIELAKLNEQSDFTGMSYDDIYAEIWNRYNEAFDDNMIAIRGCIAGPAEWCVINNVFGDEMEKYITDPECRFSARIKTLGYEGMSDDEIVTAIKEKYAGKNTARDFLNMQSELSYTNVLSNKMGSMASLSYEQMIGHLFVTTYNPHWQSDIINGEYYRMSQEQWDSAADKPFDIESFASQMRELLKHMSFEGYPINIKDIIEGAIDDFIDGPAKK